MFRVVLLCLAMGAAGGASAAVTVLNNSSHASDNIRCGVNAVAPGAIDTTIIVDTTSAPPDSTFNNTMVANATNTSRTNFASLTPFGAVNHAPYVEISNSFTSYTAAQDLNNYAALTAGGIVDNWAYVPTSTLPSTTQPPVAAVAVNQGFGGAATGYGIEFGLSSAYKGCDTSSPSGGTALMAGLLAGMRLAHPTWTWGDIKGALRQTSGNWATGYDPTNYGYGTVDYDSAVAIASTSSIFLQPPVITTAAASVPFAYTVILYPFRQTRRSNEVVWQVPRGYVWPVKNEYTSTDLSASGGTQVYSSNGTDVIPVFTYVPPASGLWALIAFTADGSGGFSRVENFSAQAVSDEFACMAQ